MTRRMTSLKSPAEIDKLRKAGNLCASILMTLKQNTVDGMTLLDIDLLARKLLLVHNATSSFLNYRGYPAVVCTSVNDEIIHGIPSGRHVKNGDLLSLDFGLFYEGYCGDTATSWVIGDHLTAAQNSLLL